MKHDLGIILNCSLCDSFFLCVIAEIDPRDWSGRQGTRALDEKNAKIQEVWADRRWTLFRCPTCVELLSSKTYLDWIEAHARDVSPFVSATAMLFSRRAKRMAKALKAEIDEANSKVNERISNMKTVRLAGNEDQEIESYKNAMGHHFDYFKSTLEDVHD